MIPEGRLARFGAGMKLPLRALGTIGAHPGLWPLVLAPVLLTIFGLIAGIVVGHYATPWMMGRIWAEPLPGVSHWLWAFLAFCLRISIALMLALALPTVLGAPFNDRLSSAVEAQVRGVEEPDESVRQFVREVLTSVVNALARLLRFGIVQALIFLLSFVPVVNVAYPVLAFVWSAVWLAEQALDQTAARHLFPWHATRDAVRAVRPMGFGMGLLLAAIFLVPLANLFLLPVATVAGALFYCDLRDAGVLPERPSGI